MSERVGRFALYDFAVISVVILLSALCGSLSSAKAETKLQKLSTDTFTNSHSEHRTEVEPHTYAYGSWPRAIWVIDIGPGAGEKGGLVVAGGYHCGIVEGAAKPYRSVPGEFPRTVGEKVSATDEAAGRIA